jgi:hypothetical protein
MNPVQLKEGGLGVPKGERCKGSEIKCF